MGTHARPFALRFVEKNGICHWIVKGHQGANELTVVNSESMRPNQITIGRNTTSSGLKLGNEGIVLGANLGRHLPLRKADLLAQFA